MAGPDSAAAPVEVAAAVIRDDAGRYLITRRPPDAHLPGLWEFPGGKREPGETLEACLRREIDEELGAAVCVGERVESVSWAYPERTVVVHFYRCRLLSERIESRHGQAFLWVGPERLAEYEFPPADRVLIDRLRSR